MKMDVDEVAISELESHLGVVRPHQTLGHLQVVMSVGC